MVEKVVDEAYQYIFESMTDITIVVKAKQLGEIIFQLQDTNLLLNALVHPVTLLEQVAERKDTIEEIAAQFEKMEQEAKTIMEVMMQFWNNVV